MSKDMKELCMWSNVLKIRLDQPVQPVEPLIVELDKLAVELLT